MGVIRDLIVVGGSSDGAARAACPAGWTRVPVDLNQGAGGRWIYLCYSTAGTRAPVVGLALSFSNDSTSTNAGPAVATRLDVDLNAGAGGDWIFLWYTRKGADLSTLPTGLRPYFSTTDSILEMTAVASDTPGVALPGWTQVRGYRARPPWEAVDPDVNRGAGGRYVYLYFRRQIPLVQNQH